MKKSLNYAELFTFCEQLAMILHSGISVLEGIMIMKEDAPTKQAEELLTTIENSLEEYGFLYQALDSSGVFPAYMVHMTEIGERSGTLDEVMSSLSMHYQREDSISKAIRSACFYPLIMLSMLLVVVGVLVIRVMPTFHQVFEQLGVDMNGISRSILSLGTVLERYAAILIAVLLFLAILLFYFSRNQKGRLLALHIFSKLPPVREFYNRLSCSRFAGGMSIALKSGLDPDESFRLVSNLIDDPTFHLKIQQAKQLLDEGEDLSEALNKSKIFSGLYSHMVSIGFRTGSADSVLEKISVSYQQEADEKMQSLISMMEPTLVAVLSILVGMILISVLLPLTGIMSNIG